MSGLKYPYRVSLCGFGGQGIVLSAVLLGTAVVTKANKYAVQTQSYGSEARGGQCQSELIIDEKPISSPTAPKKDLLVCLFQEAYNKYIHTLAEDGVLVVDSKLVTALDREGKTTFSVPATEIALSLGSKMAANMVILGFLSESCGVVGAEELKETVREYTAARFLDKNLEAIDAGIDYARQNKLYANC